MSAFHHKRIVDEFRQHGGTLTAAQIAAAVGGLWPKDIHEMRRLGYLIVEDAAGLWHLDLEDLPALDVGGAGGDDADAHPPAQIPSGAHAVASSPDADDEPEPLFEAKPEPASPYDPSVEAA